MVTVLLVEDSPATIAIFCSVLVSLNINVEVSLTYADAWHVLKQMHPKFDFVFITFSTEHPSIQPVPTSSSGSHDKPFYHRHDGCDLLMKIKGDFLLSCVPVYMISPVGDSSLYAFATRNGADGFLFKPVTDHGRSIINIFRQYRFKNHVLRGLPIGDGVKGSGLVSVGDTAPSFQLLDHNGSCVKVNMSALAKLTVLIFVPCIFCEYLYESGLGFIPRLAEEYWSCCNDLDLYLVSPDLPASLNHAKEALNLPFTCLLSDAQLQVSKRYVGTADDIIQQPTAATTNSNMDDPSTGLNPELRNLKQFQRSPILGMCIVESGGSCVFKWTAQRQWPDNDADGRDEGGGGVGVGNMVEMATTDSLGVLDYSLQPPSLIDAINSISW